MKAGDRPVFILIFTPMQFSQIINAALSQENDRPLMQKEVYPVSDALQQYLQHYKRDMVLPIDYKALFHYRYTDAIKDPAGKHTHWENVVYSAEVFDELSRQLVATYCLLKDCTTTSFQIEAIHFCEFANSMPFRIIIINAETKAEDYFYVKASDASRIYGLELEQLLTPNTINFLYHTNTLVEEHIAGTPGDLFLNDHSKWSDQEKVQLATEFVRFNERCFARLLGDMRSYNFVVISETGSGKSNYRIRAIDFDQQCYEGKLQLYLPQFYKENYHFVQLTLHALGNAAIENIRRNERKQIADGVLQRKHQLQALFHAMMADEIAENYKVVILKKELDQYHNSTSFSQCTSMGAIVLQQLTQITGINLIPGGDIGAV